MPSPHNRSKRSKSISPGETTAIKGAGDIAEGRLLSIVERIEHAEAEIRSLNRDKAEIYDEAAMAGFDKPTLKSVVKRRRQDQAVVDLSDSLLETYERALARATTPADAASQTADAA